MSDSFYFEEKNMFYKAEFKYQLTRDVVIIVPIVGSIPIFTDYIELVELIGVPGYGVLTVKKGYAWDGCSGPTFDDKTNMRACLIHDVFYQLLRLGLLNKSKREDADKLLRSIAYGDGMSKFRANYYFVAVDKFAESTSKAGFKRKELVAPDKTGILND